MRKHSKLVVVALLAVGCVAGIVLGTSLVNWLVGAGVAVVGLCLLVLRTAPQTTHCDNDAAPDANRRKLPVETSPPYQRTKRQFADDDPAALIEQMLTQGRYCLLLRPQLVGNLTPDQLERAVSAHDDAMALTPEGTVLMQSLPAAEARLNAETSSGRLVQIEPVYLDRYPVTNAQYWEFVAAGGYEQMALWQPEILPGLLDFVDRTGEPGPRYWQNGTFPEALEDHPVIGVNWFEAAAYARWVGKRIPTDPEWVKAGSWPVGPIAAQPRQRKFPWGESMDRSRAHLWGSGASATAAVTTYSNGVSVGGVYQLIGNVWEWTTTDFGVWDESQFRLELSEPLKSIRGGAFDTYFDNQSTCQFQSGESPLARKHNIGFRCAVGACDVALLGREARRTVAGKT